MCTEAVASFWRTHCASADSLALAVSGGSDSIALLHIFAQIRDTLGIRSLGVIHVDHCLRGEESNRDREFVAELSEKLELPLHVTFLGGKNADDSGIENWARERRYGFFHDVRHSLGYRYVATGHTADDQAETILLRIFRGTGLTGLHGIHAVREDGIIRPLLGLDRETLRDWLRQRSLSWREDTSNSEVHFTRNWLRSEILAPVKARFPGAVDHLRALGRDAEGIVSAMDDQVHAWISSHVSRDSDEGFVLRKPSRDTNRVVVAESIIRLFRNRRIAIDRNHVQEFLRNVSNTSGTYLLPGGWRYYPSRHSIIVEKVGSSKRFEDFETEAAIPGSVEIPPGMERIVCTLISPEEVQGRFDPENRIAFLDFERCGENLRIRYPDPGDRFRPLGGQRSRKLNDFLKSRGVNRYARARTILVSRPDHTVVWIPETAIGHDFRISSKTSRVLRISLEETSK